MSSSFRYPCLFFLRPKPFFLCAFLLLTSCSGGILQDSDLSEQSGITTPRVSAPRVAPAAPPPAPVGAPVLQTRPAPPLTVTEETATPSKTKVALLVPLSGKSSALGQAMVNAAQLAVFDVAAKDFELLPRDTGVNAVQAVSAAKEALASGAQLIIGPLFAADVSALRPAMRSSPVNLLALSTDASLAQPGIYVMGFTPAPQVERVVAYAAKQGLRRFAALLPANAYGQLVGQTFERAVKERGGELIGMEKVSNLAYLATKKDTIDALFLPFGGEELRRLAGQLEKAGFQKDKTRLLGTGLWDEGSVAEGVPFLSGGWYATADPDARQRFEESYKDAYGASPPRLATLAYDATALAAVLAKSERGFGRESLTSPMGFAGLDGVFRLSPNGPVERKLAISETGVSGNQIVDPAPTSFETKP